MKVPCNYLVHDIQRKNLYIKFTFFMTCNLNLGRCNKLNKRNDKLFTFFAILVNQIKNKSSFKLSTLI